MDQLRSKPFPLSRYRHYDSFRHYYPFGNSPAEDFLRSVPGSENPTTLLRPAVLSLACGDIRSCMYTLWKNFGMDGKSCSTFKGMDFVLNDCSASVLARNGLFLYLCLQMPKYDSKSARREWLEWIASVWAIWYNHELAPQHHHVFTSALNQLLQWSKTPQGWEKCPLGQIVSFSSLTTFEEIKNVWALWAGRDEGFRVKSVSSMKKERKSYQAFHFRSKSLDQTTEKMRDTARSRLKHLQSTYTQDRIEAMVQESCAYLEDGTAYAEKVLDLKLPSSCGTIVNRTFYQQPDGSYTLHYALDPYVAFHHFILYSPTEVCKMILHGQVSTQALPVPDEHFTITTLLANSVQQFGMWITATANILKQSDKCGVSFTLDCSDAIGFCQKLFQFQDQCWEGLGIMKFPNFDAIFTSNVIDHLMPGSALVVAAAKLLKPNAALFITTFSHSARKTTKTLIEEIFGLPSEFLPVILGIRCIGNDGKYSSTTTAQPAPFEPSRVTLIWKNIISHPLIITSLTNESHFMASLLKSCISVLHNRSAFDSFLAIADCFIAQLSLESPPSYQFWEPLCRQIAEEPLLQRHLIQIQTQSFLHGFHMHITVAEDSCPLCRGQALEDYIGGYTVSFRVSLLSKYEEPKFLLHLYFTPSDFAIITSVVGSTIDSNVQLDFFFPKEELKRCKNFALYKNVEVLYAHLYQPFAIETGEVNSKISFAPQKYQFMKYQKIQSSLPIESSMGKILHHSGDAIKFETTISLSEECLRALKTSKLEVVEIDTGERKLKLTCGESVHMSIVYPYPIQTNVHIKFSKKKKVITLFAERATLCSYNEEPTLFFDLQNILSLPKICRDDRNLQTFFMKQLPLKTIDPSGVVCIKNIFYYIATQTSEEYFVVKVGGKDSMRVGDIMIAVHSVHIDPYFESPMVSLSFCFPHNFVTLIQQSIFLFWFKLTKIDYSEFSVDEDDLKCLKQALLYSENSTRKSFSNTELPSAVANHPMWQYFHHALIHPLYPNVYLEYVRNEIQHFMNDPYRSLYSSSSALHKSESYSANADLQSHSLEKCANCKKFQSNMKRCGNCNKVRYCGKECQRKHWKEHKSNCKRSSTAHTSTLASCGRCKKQTTSIPCSCESVSYCSAECQSLDWPVHKDKCTSTPSVKSKNTCNEANSEIMPSTQKEQDTEEIEECNIKSQESSAMHVGTRSLDVKQQQTSINEMCSYCKRRQYPLKKCLSCGKVQYCGKECQRKHWKKHKSTCKLSSAAPTSTLASCGRCKKQTTSIPCSCRSVSYCSTECQSLDWLVHKDKCTSTPSAKSKNTSNEANSEIMPSTQKEQDTEEIEECNIKPQESSAMHGGTRSLDAKEQQTSITEMCSYCKKDQSALKKCLSCGKVQYCGKECQRKHLKEHKSTCKLSSAAPTSTLASCGQCEKQTTSIPCSCGSVSYCSTECQSLEWPVHKDKRTSTPSAKSKNTNKEANSEMTPSTQKEQDIKEIEECNIKPQESSALHGDTRSLDAKQQQTSMTEICSYCKKARGHFPLRKCLSCGNVQYCGKECQRKHWKEHKSTCKLSSTNAIIQVLDKCTSTSSAKSKHVSNEPDADSTLFQPQDPEALDTCTDKETAACSALLSTPTNKTHYEKQICSRCKKLSTTLHQCPCHRVSYCTVECQRLDWPKHKDVCQKRTSLAI